MAEECQIEVNGMLCGAPIPRRTCLFYEAGVTACPYLVGEQGEIGPDGSDDPGLVGPPGGPDDLPPLEWATDYEHLATLIAGSGAGQSFVDRLMEGYEDPKYGTTATGLDVCLRCGALVGAVDLHSSFHRYQTLGLRSHSVEILIHFYRSMAAEEEAARVAAEEAAAGG